MISKKKDAIINLSIFIVSLTVSIVAAYFIYNFFIKTKNTVVYQGEDSDYALSFYNRKGQKISRPNGTLKLMLDPFTIYRNYPHQKSSSYSLDKFGFRNNFTAQKNDKESKIAFILGGSAAFGQGLDSDDKTFTAKLNRSHQDFKFINSGVVGFLSGQELSQMIHYLDNFNPSFYIVFDGWNDIYDPYIFAFARKSWPIRNAPIGYNNTFLTIEDRLAKYYQIERQQKDKDGEQEEEINKEEMNLEEAGEALPEDRYFTMVVEEYTKNISKMNSFANSRKAKYLVIFQPELGNKKNVSFEEKEMLEDWNKSLGYLDKDIPGKYRNLVFKAKNFCKENNIEYLDINEESEFINERQTVFYDVVHPNELGHEIIAKIIQKKLAKEKQ